MTRKLAFVLLVWMLLSACISPRVSSLPNRSSAHTAKGNPSSQAKLVNEQQWVGQYRCGQSLAPLTIDISQVFATAEMGPGSVRVEGVLSFGPHGSLSGAYVVAGAYTASNQTITLAPVSWIDRPADSIAVGLRGRIDTRGTTITGRIDHSGCGDFVLSLVRDVPTGGVPATNGRTTSEVQQRTETMRERQPTPVPNAKADQLPIATAPTQPMSNAEFDDRCRSKRAQSAIRGCSLAIESKQLDVTQSGKAYLSIGSAYEELNDLASAASFYSKGISLLPSSYVGYLLRGQVYEKLKQFDLALADFARVIIINDSRGLYDAYTSRGITYARMGDFPRAVADFDKAIAIEPGQTRARINRDLALRRQAPRH